MLNIVSNIILAVARSIKYVVNVTIVVAVFILVIWILNLAHNGIREMFFSTKETNYETQLVQKATHLLDIILPSDKYLVFASVKFRDKVEKIQQHVKDPKELDEIKSSSMSREMIAAPKIKKMVMEAEESIQLPGMEALVTTANRFSIQDDYGKEEKTTESQTHQETAKSFYFDEKKIEVSYDNTSISNIKVTVLVDPAVITENELSVEGLQATLLDVLPLDLERGDLLSVKTQAIELKPTFFENVYQISQIVYEYVVEYLVNPVVFALNQLAKYWQLIATIIGIMVAIPVVKYLFENLIKLIKYVNTVRKENQAKRDAAQKAEEAQNAIPVNVDSKGVPESYPSGVIDAVKTKKKESVEVLKYWMGLDNNE
ncbi:MAG: hypothetical protein CMP39_06775 [Rickettsiales bacterium]|nr:hypothetical protein [Rickettsiales bacterium]